MRMTKTRRKMIQNVIDHLDEWKPLYYYDAVITYDDGTTDTWDVGGSNAGEALMFVLRSTSKDGVHPSVHRVKIIPQKEA